MVFQPGQSGNPLGYQLRARPWKEAIMRALKRQQVLLRSDKGKLSPSVTHPEHYDPLGVGGHKVVVPVEQSLEIIADLTVQMALCGDKEMINEIGLRLDGRPPQTIEGGDFPLVTEVRWLDDEADDVVDGEVVEVHANNGAALMPPQDPPKPKPTPTPDDDDDDAAKAALEGDDMEIVDLDGDDVLGND